MTRLFFLCMMLGTAFPSVAATPLRATDFAYGVEIKTTGDEPFFEVIVPEYVYTSVTRSDLGDLRVFNGNDEVVPHALKRPERPDATGEWLARPLFPVQAGREQRPGEVSLRVDRDKSGSIVEVRTAEGAAPNAPIAFYIVETNTGNKPVRTLEVDWKDEQEEGFAGRMAVDASDDLNSWRTIVADAPVLRLLQAGEALDRRQIALGAITAKYLRLRWIEPAYAAPMLTALRIEYRGDVAPPERQWSTLAATSGDKPGEYLYTVAGRMPIDRVRIHLPQSNTLAFADLHMRTQNGDPWQRRAGGLIYRVSKGGHEVTQGDWEVSPSTDTRQWRLTLSEREGGLGAEPPSVEVGWQPHTVVFAARGAGPYRLAYGKAGITPADASIEQLLTEEQDGKPRFTARPAQLGMPQELGGAKQLSLPLAERSWRTWVLWAVLIAGVLLLGWMAMRLARQLKASDSAR